MELEVITDFLPPPGSPSNRFRLGRDERPRMLSSRPSETPPGTPWPSAPGGRGEDPGTVPSPDFPEFRVLDQVDVLEFACRYLVKEVTASGSRPPGPDSRFPAKVRSCNGHPLAIVVIRKAH